VHDWQIETVRGRITDALADELRAFWAREAGFSGAAAEDRLAEVTCVLRDGGELAGVCSVYPAAVPLVADRRFWVFRSLLPGAAEEQWQAMARATFAVLDSDHVPGPDAPEGLCLLADAEQRRRHPEAEWSEPRMVHAGFLADGRQVRIGYFHSEVSSMSPSGSPGSDPITPFTLVRFADQDLVGESEVLELWTREAGLPAEEARRRLGELLFVGVDGSRVAGISTVYLARQSQLQADLWHFRTFTAAAYRRTNVAISLVIATREYLQQRHISGEDRRAQGMVFEIENPELKAVFPRGLWYESDVVFVGENARGDHVRVHWFPGTLTPEP
jgi:hypothetical protein